MAERIEDLEKQGWTRQFEAAEPRLSEAVSMYEETGYEVHLEPLDVSQADENSEECKRCRACFEGFEDRYRIIFTRKREEAREQEDELFGQ